MPPQQLDQPANQPMKLPPGATLVSPGAPPLRLPPGATLVSPGKKPQGQYTTGDIDYTALAKQYGATSSTPANPAKQSVDYAALAKQYGATSSVPPRQTGQYTTADVAGAPGVTLDFSKSQPIQGPADPYAAYGGSATAPSTFKELSSGAIESIGNIVKGQVQQWLHGGIGAGEASDARQSPAAKGETFNPFHPVETAGYLVPQPIKNLVSDLQNGRYAHAIGSAAPYATQIPRAIDPAGIASDTGQFQGGAPPVADVTTDPNFSARSALAPQSQLPAEATNVPIVDAKTGLPAPATPARQGAVVNKIKQAANVGLRKIPVAGGAAVGGALGSIAGPVGATVGAVTGGALGNEFADSMPQFSIPQEAEAAKPAAAEPVAASASAPQPTAQAPAETPAAQPAATVASQDDIAKAVGYPGGAKQAVDHLGPEVWNQVYQKVAGNDAQPAGEPSPSQQAAQPRPAPAQQFQAARQVNSTVDSIIPPSGATKGANLRARAEADFYLQRGNVEAATESVRKNAAAAGIDMPAASPTQFPPPEFQPRTKPLTAAQRADALDDKITQEAIQARVGTDLVSPRSLNWRNPNSQEALIADATARKVPTSVYGRQVYGEALAEERPQLTEQASKSDLAKSAKIAAPQSLAQQPAQAAKPYVQAAQEFTQQVARPLGADVAKAQPAAAKALSTKSAQFQPGDRVLSPQGKVYEVAKGGPGGRWLNVKPLAHLTRRHFRSIARDSQSRHNNNNFAENMLRASRTNGVTTLGGLFMSRIPIQVKMARVGKSTGHPNQGFGCVAFVKVTSVVPLSMMATV